MSNDAKIKPALALEDLKDLPHAVLSHGIANIPDIAARQVALANWALPDAHPLKLTREDALLIREAEDNLGDYGESAMCERLLKLAAKIEALLPPE